MWNSPNMLTIFCVLRPTVNRHHRRHGRQDMAVVVSTLRQGRSSSRSPEYFDTGETQTEREREVTMSQPVAYTRYSQRVWTNANLAKDFVKVKTYSDLIVLKQDSHDKLGEPARWVLYVTDFDKSSYPTMDKARAEQWMNMYSILDRSTLEKAVFELIKESLVDFHLVRYLIDEVQIGSVDSVSKLWEDIFTTFPVYSRPIRFEYIAHCILTAYTANCDDASTYNSRLSTVHKARVALGDNYHYRG
jgi:hypothetical protein